MKKEQLFVTGFPLKPQTGFTLIELLVVLAIISLMAGLVGPKVMKHLGDAKTKAARLQISDLGIALDSYKLDVGRYPNSNEGLSALVEQPSGVNGWSGPYLSKNKIPKDPWEVDYKYRSPGEHGSFDIVSLGSDNREGGEGEDRDVVSWE